MVHRTTVAIERYLLALALAECTQVIDAVQMIGVRVGIKYRVDARQSFTQGLLPQIGTGIDKDNLPA
jgi:hypothetical protein